MDFTISNNYSPCFMGKKPVKLSKIINNGKIIKKKAPSRPSLIEPPAKNPVAFYQDLISKSDFNNVPLTILPKPKLK